MGRFVDKLFVRLRERGYETRMISISHMQLLRKEIECLRNNDSLDSEFYQSRLAWFSFQVLEDLPDAQSLIVVAVQDLRPSSFYMEWERRPLTLPPHTRLTTA